MRSLDDIDVTRAITLHACAHDLEQPMLSAMDGVKPITLSGADARAFIDWAASATWRPAFERDLQSVSETLEGSPLLSTWLPLVTIRESFCSGGRNLQAPTTKALMAALRAAMREWRALGVDTVEISGHMATLDRRGTLAFLTGSDAVQFDASGSCADALPNGHEVAYATTVGGMAVLIGHAGRN